MKNGDVISFWTTCGPFSPLFPDRMQVWLNPTNESLDVGRSPGETGDYTVKLIDINEGLTSTGYPTEWTKYQIIISGLANGDVPQKHRIGFRYYVPGGGTGGSYSWEIGLDDFDFTSN